MSGGTKVDAKRLLDRELSKALTEDLRRVGGDALCQVVDYGVRVSDRCLRTATGAPRTRGGDRGRVTAETVVAEGREGMEKLKRLTKLILRDYGLCG